VIDPAARADITKSLDATQGAGFTSPDNFQTGSLVRYRIKISCLTLTYPCYTGTVTDVLPASLIPVQVILPPNSTVAMSSSISGQTVTINAGNATGDASTRFDGGDSAEAVIVARVNGNFNGGTIDNQAHVQLPNDTGKDSEIVTIKVPAPTPQYGLTKFKSAPGTPAAGGTVTYQMFITFPTKTGNVPTTGGTFTDTLPLGAEIINAGGGVVGTDASGNPTITWTVDAFDPATIGTGEWGSGYYVYSKFVTVKFPSPPFTAGQTVTNKAHLTLHFANYPDGVYTADAPVTLGAASYTIGGGKQGPTTASIGQKNLGFRIYFGNTGNVDQHNLTVIDHIPAGYTNIRIQPFLGGGTTANPVTVSYSADGATWTVLFTDTGTAWAQNPFPVPAGNNWIKVVYPTVVPGTYVDRAIYFLADAPTDVPVDTIVRNCADVQTDEMTAPATYCQDTKLVAPFSNLYTAKRHFFVDPSATAILPGETFKWQIAARPEAGIVPQEIRLVDTLPKEFEYLGVRCAGVIRTADWGTAQVKLSSDGEAACAASSVALLPAPTIEHLPTGETRLTWVFAPSTLYNGKDWSNAATVGITLNVKTKLGTAVGSYTNHMYVQSTTDPTTCFTGQSVTGVDGKSACGTQDAVIVDQAGVLAGTKWDDGYPGLPHVDQTSGQPSDACPDWGGYTRFPCVAQTIPDGAFSYRWDLANGGNIDLTDYVFYDILPYLGDTGVSQTLSGASRGTEWSSVTLTGPIQVLSAPENANVVIEYNQSYNPCRPEVASGATDSNWQGSCDNNWSSSYVGAKSFRIKAFQMVDGVHPAWPIGTSIELQAPMKAPADAVVSQPNNLSIAWNSFAHRAYRLNGDGTVARLLAAEPEKVGIIIPFDFYRLGNQLWLDNGAAAGHADNGVYDTDEQPIGGATVELWADNGDGVFDPATDKKVNTTTTDANGNYWFSINRDTKYFVAIPSGQTGQTAGTSTIDLADYLSSTGQTTGDNKDNGAPLAGYAAVSGVVSVTDQSAPTGEQDTNDTVSAETEANASSTGPVDDANSDLTIDFGFVRDGYYDLALVKVVDNASPVQPTDTITWTVRVRNQGTLTSGAVTVLDNIPTGLIYVTDSCAGATSCTESNGVITWSIDDLAASTDVDLTFKATIGDVTKAPFRNWAEIASDSGDDKDSTPNSAETNGTVGQDATLPNDDYVGIDSLADATIDQVAGDEDDNDDASVDVQLVYDLALAKVTSATSVTDGGQVTWTIRVQNQGNLPSGRYTVTDTLPTGMSFVSCAGATACAETAAGSGVVTFTMPNLAAGSFADVTLVTKVTDIAAGPFRNWAEISADSGMTLYGVTDKDSTPDTTTGHDQTMPNDSYVSVTDLATIATDGQPADDEDDNDDATVGANIVYDLALVKVVDNQSPVQPTDTITWTVRVRNQGNVPSKEFTVSDNIPTGLSYVADSCTGGATCSVTGTQVSWNITDLAAGAELDLTYQATISDLTKAPFRNWAEITSDSAEAVYGTTDKDSTPDTDIGQDATLPNDDYVGIDNLDDATIDQVAGDEDDNDDASIDVQVVYDLALAKVTSSSNVNVGDDVSWTIRIRNQGNVPSGVYTVTDTIPSGMTYVSCAGATTCSQAGGVVTYTMPSLAAGAFADITLVTKVADMNKQPFRNWAEISSDSGMTLYGVTDKDSTPDTNTGHDNTLPNDDYVSITDLATIATDSQPANDEDDNDDAVVTGAVHYDLALIKTASTTSVAYGGETTWTVTVKNQGNVDSGLYDVTDTLPSGMDYVSSSPAGTVSGSVLTWADQSNLAPGATATFTVVTKAVDMTKRPFRNWAEISKDSGDDEDSTPDTNTGQDQTPPNDAVDNHNDINLDQPPNDEDDNDYEEVAGDVVYDLALIKTVQSGSVEPGGEATFTVTVANQGNVPSRQFTVTDQLPAGLAFVSASDNGVPNAGVVTWTIADLAAGATKSLTVTVKVTDPTLRPYRNWAEISSDSSGQYSTPTAPVTDKDSTPDSNTGSDPGQGMGTNPNDDVVNHNDITKDSVDGDEDDNDYEDLDVAVRYDLALAKVVTTTGTVIHGDPVTWQIRVRNQGNVASGLFDVTDTLPTGMRFVSASNGGTAAGQTVTWKKLPSLEPGASVTLTLTTQVISTQAGSFRNWAEISADSSSTYGPDVHDKDSTPDTTTGSDQTLPNDPYVGIDDLGLIDTDGLPGGDEDDNDDAVVVVSAVIPPPTGPTTVPSTTPTTAPSTTPTTPTTVPFTGTTQPTGTLPKTGTDSTGLIGWAGLITALGAGLWLATRRRRTAGQR